MLILKRQTCLSDKMLLKKVNIKKLFSNCAKSNFFSFFIFTFFLGHFVTKTSLHFLNQYKIVDFFYTLYDLFQEKKFHISEGLNKMYQHKNQKTVRTTKNKEKCLF
jgi:hypothetical protein